MLRLGELRIGYIEGPLMDLPHRIKPSAPFVREYAVQFKAYKESMQIGFTLPALNNVAPPLAIAF